MNPNGSIEATTSTLYLMEYYEQENYGEMLHTDTHEKEKKRKKEKQHKLKM